MPSDQESVRLANLTASNTIDRHNNNNSGSHNNNMFGFKKESKVSPDESTGGGILGLSASRGSLLSEDQEVQPSRAWCWKEEKSESWDKWMKFFSKIGTYVVRFPYHLTLFVPSPL